MPLRLFPHKTNFDFMGKRWIGFSFSIILTLASLGILFTKGLNLGIDFTGGILMEIQTEQPADLSILRDALNGQGFGEVSLQNVVGASGAGSANDVLIRVQMTHDEDQ